jgi:SWI/SNF-related matrix-associated actin-dependent regulator of chromatin subfamily A3
MSAKRRQETLERFCVPIGEDSVEAESITSPVSMPPTTQSNGRAARRRAATQLTKQFPDLEAADNDTDFSPEEAADDDNSFLDDSEDDSIWSKKGKGKCTAKAKANGKGKGKAMAKARFATSTRTTFYESSSLSGRNPKVMLISLKAGALGLNLTVANNVYL